MKLFSLIKTMEHKGENVCSSHNTKLLELKPCWIAGERKLSKANFNKFFPRVELEAVNVFDSCKKIRELLEVTEGVGVADITSYYGGSRVVAFKDIARLTFGVSLIYNQQVLTLLDETKQLLNKIEGLHYNVDFTRTPVRSQVKNNGRRKRRLTILQQTITTVSKLARIEEPQFLDDANLEFYRNMLDEPLWWNNVENIEQEGQYQPTCTSNHLISINDKLIIVEKDEDLMLNDGFGEDSNELDESALEELLPLRNTLKRKSPELQPNNNKRPKLTRKTIEELLDLQTSGSEEQVIDPVITIPLPGSPPVQTKSAAQFQKSKSNSRSKSKLIIDNCIKLSREQLMKDRQKYLKGLSNNIAVVKSHKNKNDKELLNSFRQDHLFPSHLKELTKMSSEQQEIKLEYTIRSIFGVDYSDALASNILCGILETDSHLSNYLGELTEPTITDAPENKSSQELTVPQNNNNNNNINDTLSKYELNNKDSYNIMMELLTIWRNNPEQKSIDASQFIKSFPNRLKAASAFSHLLTLSRDGFIRISTKLNSVEINEITLGPHSVQLIENISNIKKM